MKKRLPNSISRFADLPNGAYFIIKDSIDHCIYKKWEAFSDDLVLPSTGELYNAILITPDGEVEEQDDSYEEIVNFIDEDQEVERYYLVQAEYHSWS